MRLARLAPQATLLAAVVLATHASPSSAAPSKGNANASAVKSCVAAHEQAQTLRTQKKLHAAREKFVACAKSDCPVVLRKECTEQMEQLESSAPTVALEAIDDKGMGDPQVKVTIDGLVVADKLTGGALPVEPGEHVFRFERASDGKAIEQRVLVVEGEKNKKIVADYQALLPKPETPPATPQPGPEKKVPVLAYVAGGVAVLGLGSFAFFSISGRSEESDAAKRCEPRCTDSDLSPIKRDYLIGDISLGVAIVAAAAAVVLALPALSSSPKGASSGKSRPNVLLTF